MGVKNGLGYSFGRGRVCVFEGELEMLRRARGNLKS